MEPIKKKRCRHCKKLFSPDPRNATRQEYCHAPECRKTIKAESQKRWIKNRRIKSIFADLNIFSVYKSGVKIIRATGE